MTTEQPVASVRGVVLAGGNSNRFADGDKAVASVAGEPLLSRTVTVLRAATQREPIIVVDTQEERATYATAVEGTDVRFVFDAPAYDGPLAGIVGAARALDSQWLFCCGCDMPLLAPTAVSWMIDQLRRTETTREPPVDAVAVVHPTGVVEPLHTLYRRESVIGLQQSLSNTAGPRRLLSKFDRVSTVSIADVPAQIPIEPSTTNANTVEELDRIRHNSDSLLL
ncbi:molybdenum cofactor guanylyltransferase [Halohasta litorea]|uniref:Probable molybdenum cofactor guanylyltransferase n=1 Tax=Halohasta litorea TaxID=869891 RepID=A0ABD6D9Y3_9EURY|nr:molybdenum cofactor guanylyltransferase [Halohasta litorea]